MLELLKKLDRSSRILILVALVGILGSVISIYQVSNQSASGANGERLATLTSYTHDTRLKRSGNIHWYSVREDLECFENDRVFTGKDSYATIEFEGGGKVVVLPNSLISLSRGFVKLNSGTIEVDLQKGAVGIESFGEKFIPKEKTKFRLENRKEVKRIVPLLEDKKLVSVESNVRLKEFIRPERLTLVAPENGGQLPNFPESTVFFSWRTASDTQASFLVEFATSDKFSSVIYSQETDRLSLAVPSETFPVGPVHWRVTEVKTKGTASSTFVMNGDIDTELLAPSNSSRYPQKTVASEGLNFEWSNGLRLPQKFQVSQSTGFQKLIVDSDVRTSQKTYKFSVAGTYYWRVGYPYGKDLVHWSKVFSFTLTPEVVIAPLELTGLPKIMDFSLTQNYSVRVNDLNKCDEYEFVISKGGTIVLSSLASVPEFKVLRLEDGDYQMKVVGKLKGAPLSESQLESFTVKNSPPLKAPKIRKKNVKLYVKLLKGLVDSVIGSAYAAPGNAFYTLQWEPEDGVSYEVEISKDDKTIVELKETKTPEYKFFIPGPERYFWRVRTLKGKRKGPFSEYAEISVLDKVTSHSGPLMVSPPSGKAIRASKEDVNILFKWNEPSRSYKYYLEIYDTETSPRPTRTFEVQGGRVSINEDDLAPEVYWRVVAKSQYGNQTPNQEKFKLLFTKHEDKFKLGAFTLQPALSSNSMVFKHDYKNDQISELASKSDFSGPAFHLNVEYFFSRWPKRSLLLGYRGIGFEKGDSEYTEHRLGAEFGWIGDRFHHFYAGVLANNGRYVQGADLNLENKVLFVTGRYVYKRDIGEKFHGTADLGLFVQMDHLQMPSYTLKPTLSYKYSEKFWLDLFASIERYSIELKPSGGGDEKIGIVTENLGIGLGVTWRNGI